MICRPAYAPCVGIADADVDASSTFAFAFALVSGAIQSSGRCACANASLMFVDHSSISALAFGGKYLLDVDLADRVAERRRWWPRARASSAARCCGVPGASLPWKAKLLVLDAWWQRAACSLIVVERQPVLPRLAGFDGDQAESRRSRPAVGLEASAALPSWRGGEERSPVDPRRLVASRAESTRCRRGHVVARPRRVRLRDLHFELEIAGPRASSDSPPASACSIWVVLAARIPHLGRRSRVVFAVRHAEAALQQVGHALRRGHPGPAYEQPEQVLGVEIGGVDRVDVDSALSRPARA